MGCKVLAAVCAVLKRVWPRAEYWRWVSLTSMEIGNRDLGSLAAAQRHGEELRSLAENYKHEDDGSYGNAVQKGNLILGRIALRRGDLEAAKGYLPSAGRTPGSANLNSFGPNMLLAKEQLELGESETVLEYFGLCETFWKMGPETLKRWSEAVQDGEAPVFGPNLRY